MWNYWLYKSISLKSLFHLYSVCSQLWSAPLHFSVLSVYLTEPLEYGLWQQSRHKLFSLHTIKFHCPFSHQGIVVEIALKWTISVVCAPYPLGQVENISCWGKGNWGGGRWFRTFLLSSLTYYLVGLNHITVYNFSHLCTSSSSPYSAFLLLLLSPTDPWGDVCCHPFHLWGFCCLTTQQSVVPRGQGCCRSRRSIHYRLVVRNWRWLWLWSK